MFRRNDSVLDREVEGDLGAGLAVVAGAELQRFLEAFNVTPVASSIVQEILATAQ